MVNMTSVFVGFVFLSSSMLCSFPTAADTSKDRRHAREVAHWGNTFESEMVALAADSTIAIRLALMEYERRAVPDADPESLQEDLENRLVAAPVVSMLMGLHTMKRTEEILTNATKMVVNRYWDYVHSDDSEVRSFLFHQWMGAVDEFMYGEQSFEGEYDERKVDWRNTFALNSRTHVWWNGQTIGRRAFVNRVFRKHAFDSDRAFNGSSATRSTATRHYLLAKAIVQLAKANSVDKIPLNLVYNHALHDTAKNLPVNENDEDVVREELLATLERLLKADADIGVKVDLTLMSWELNGVDLRFAENKPCQGVYAGTS